MNTTPQYDAIIVGGGHNGLVNAAYLAKAGLKPLVLEKRSVVGGAAVTEERLPGFRFTTFSYAISLLRPDIVHDLNLTHHGLMILPMPTTFAPMENGDYLLLGADSDLNYHEIARHSLRDAESYAQYNLAVARISQAIKPLVDNVPPNVMSEEPAELAHVAALNQYMNSLAPDVQQMLSQLVSGSAAEWLEPWFESDIMQGLMASSGIIGSKLGPRSPGSGLVLLYHSMGEIDGVFHTWGFHKDGNGGFTQALARAAHSFGVEIRTGSSASEVILKGDRAVGVALETGEEIRAPIVVSALDPRRTFLHLIGERQLPAVLVEQIKAYKFQGVSAKVNFALADLPRYPALKGRSDQFRGFINIAPSIDYLERAFADATKDRYSRKPFIDICIQSTIDRGMAPPGKHVMSCFVQYAPYQLSESNWDKEKENFGNAVQSTLEDYFPGFGQLVLHREVVTPLDIERTIGLSEGNIFQGELFSEQMYFCRPAPGWNQYRTPIRGYYQCGSGTHPGGCVMGAPGQLASRQILADLKMRNKKTGIGDDTGFRQGP